MKKYRVSVLWSVILVAFVVLGLRDRNVENPVVAQQSTAAYNADVEALRESIGNFFENLSDSSKGARKAVDEFVKNSAMAENEKTRAKIADGLKTINANFGEYVSYEAIGVKTVGTDIIVFRYLYKCQDYPIVWYFTFYRPRSKSQDGPASSWNLIGFRYDTNLDAALLDATF